MKDIKIALIGSSGVGKQTLINLILGLKTIPGMPTQSLKMVMKKGEILGKYSSFIIAGTIEGINTGEIKMDFFADTDLVLFISYRFKDMLNTSKLKEKMKNYLPDARFAVIANKQDLDDSVDATQVVNFFNLPVIGLVAIDPDHRDSLLNFIDDILNI